MAVAVLKKSKSTESLGNFEGDQQFVKHFRDKDLGLIRMKQRAKRPKSAIMKPKSQLLFIVRIQGGVPLEARRSESMSSKATCEHKVVESNKTVGRIRARGGNVKWRALRLDTGNYSWGSEAVTRKARILDVVYNTSNNEMVRTQTLNKTAAALAKKEGEEGESAAASPAEEAKKSNHLQRKIEKHQKDRKLDAHIEELFVVLHFISTWSKDSEAELIELIVDTISINLTPPFSDVVLDRFENMIELFGDTISTNLIPPFSDSDEEPDLEDRFENMIELHVYKISSEYTDSDEEPDLEEEDSDE
ncbi:hypothetical protein LWI28_013304 [Acer negundo]|uniref:40S ribosomal protein S8 n=1 Tax=Acer negundo TaxID=4023 RepID=A0AAD5IMV9_ACENE|nr:hypothetical protein LWI28_013304 [Acer negundo]